MLKLTTLAAAAAVLITTQANAASVTVVLTGKTPDQVHTEITRAAHYVCVRETTFEPRRHEAMVQCEKDTLATAMAEAEVKLAKMTSAKTLASR